MCIYLEMSENQIQDKDHSGRHLKRRQEPVVTHMRSVK